MVRLLLSAALLSPLGGCTARSLFDARAVEVGHGLPPLDGFTVDTYSSTFEDWTEVQGASIELGPLPSGAHWLVMASGTIVSSGYTTAWIRLMADSQELSLGRPAGAEVAPMPWNTVAVVDAGRRLTVEIRSDGRATVTVQALSVVAMALPASADLHWSELESQLIEHQPGDFDWVASLSLTVQPAEPGEYLVLGTTAAREGPGDGTLSMRLEDGTGARWPSTQSLAVSRQSWTPFLLARSQILSGARTYRWMAYPDEILGSSVKHARMIAFRTDALESFMAAQIFDDSLIDGVSDLVQTRLSVPPGDPGDDRVVLQSQWTWVAHDVAPNPERRVSFLTPDGTILRYDGNELSAMTRPSHVVVSPVRTAAGFEVENRVAAPDGNVHGAESTIFVMGAPRR